MHVLLCCCKFFVSHLGHGAEWVFGSMQGCRVEVVSEVVESYAVYVWVFEFLCECVSHGSIVFSVVVGCARMCL